jgi:hypothetical protein
VIAVQGGFEHDLWRDYLVSRHLSRNPGQWSDATFDRVTVLAHALESLSLTVEQLPDQDSKNRFLEAVYDWNYAAAGDCVEEFRGTDPDARQLGDSIRLSIYGAIAEKRFDPVPRTQERARDYLVNHQDPRAEPFSQRATRAELVEHVRHLDGPESWFQTWKDAFIRPDGQNLTPEDIGLLRSDSSLVGWAVANLVRRSNLDPGGQRRLRELYAEELAAGDSRRTIRWRIVHALGRFPTHENAEMLLQALRNDPYHWVRYGAARSLMELAARGDEALRREVLARLMEYVGGYREENVWIRRQLLRELIEVSFIADARPGWRESVRPLLELVLQKEQSPQYRSEWQRRVGELYQERVSSAIQPR